MFQRRQQDAVDERGLARARDAGDGHEVTEGHVDRDVLQVVGARALDGQFLAVAATSRRGNGNRLLSGEVLAGQ